MIELQLIDRRPTSRYIGTVSFETPKEMKAYCDGAARSVRDGVVSFDGTRLIIEPVLGIAHDPSGVRAEGAGGETAQ